MYHVVFSVHLFVLLCICTSQIIKTLNIHNYYNLYKNSTYSVLYNGGILKEPVFLDSFVDFMLTLLMHCVFCMM